MAKVEYERSFDVAEVNIPQQQNTFQDSDLPELSGTGFAGDGYQPPPREHREHREPYRGRSEPEHQEPEEEYEDEQLEEESEEEQPEEEVEEREEKKRYRDPAKARINAIQRDKYSALEANARLREENDRLKRLAAISTEAASRSFEDNVLQRLEQAKQLQIQAIESGDVSAQADASLKLADAMADYKSHNVWKAQEQLREQEQAYRAPEPTHQPPVVNREQAMNWVERNSWANPNSRDYDQELFSIADNVANQLELHCYKIGRPDLIQSPEYFQQLDAYVEQARNSMEQAPPRSQQSTGRSRIPMKQQTGRTAVTPVRSGSQNARTKKDHGLTDAQKEIANNMGIKHDVYAAYAKKDAAEKPERYWREQGR